MSLKKQVGHANQQTGFSDSTSLCPVHPQAQHIAPGLLAAPRQVPVQVQPAGSQASRLPANLALSPPSVSTAGPRDSATSVHQIISSVTPHLLRRGKVPCVSRPVIATATRGDQALPPVKGTLALCPRKPFMSHLAPGGARLPHGTASPHHQGLVHFPTPCRVP